jgi:large conductance mechanosensitive channel
VLKDFKQFLLKGNLVALAVAFVIGLAFSAVVTALVGSLITPLIAAIGGNPDFSALTFSANGSVFRYGVFLNALISFVLVAAVLFFLVVRPYNALEKRFERGEDDDIPSPEYAVETGSATALPGLLNARAADGWRVVSVGDSSDGGLAAVLVRGEE